MDTVKIIDAVSNTCAAATPKTVVSVTDLAKSYRRVDLTLRNTGSNAVTAATFKVGNSTRLANDTTKAADIVTALTTTSTGTYVLSLADIDIPESLEIVLTSGSGTTVVAELEAALY